LKWYLNSTEKIKYLFDQSINQSEFILDTGIWLHNKNK